jgi:SAM-dependent methyltransferase
VRPAVYYHVLNLIQTVSQNKGIALEIGSFDVNGSLTPIFSRFNYIGLDMRKGKNVDLVARGDNLPFPSNSCSCVVCCDTLEHDDNFFGTVSEMKRVLASDGLMILAVPGIGFKLHEHPCDYWRFTFYAVELLLKGLRNIKVTQEGNALMGHGFK